MKKEVGEAPLITSLYLSCAKGNLPMVQKFVDEAKNNSEFDFQTPLRIAAANGRLEIVKFLKSANLNFEFKSSDFNKMKETPLMEASKLGHLNVVHYLVSNSSIEEIDFHDECGRTAFWNSLLYQQDQVSNYLIVNGCDCEKIPNLRLLEEFSKYGTLSKLNFYFEKFCLKNQTNLNQILSAVIKFGTLEFLKYFTSQGLDYENPDNENASLLGIACEKGRYEMVNYLLSIGFKWNEVNWNFLCKQALNPPKDENTPTDYLKVLKYLVLAGYKITDDLESYLKDSIKRGHLDLLKFLSENGFQFQRAQEKFEAISIAIEFGGLEILKYLVLIGCNPDNEDKYGKNAIMLACQLGQREIVKYLVSIGTNINCQDKEGRTPFFLACKFGNIYVAKLLVSLGCDVNLTPTPLFIAKSENHGNVVEWLEKSEFDQKGSSKQQLLTMEEKLVLKDRELQVFKQEHLNFQQKQKELEDKLNSALRELEISRMTAKIESENEGPCKRQKIK